jgi:hypothetical protein
MTTNAASCPVMSSRLLTVLQTLHIPAVLCAGRAPGAGTDADVSVELTGTSGTFGPHMLPASTEAFQEGCRDSFRCVCLASMHH